MSTRKSTESFIRDGFLFLGCGGLFWREMSTRRAIIYFTSLVLGGISISCSESQCELIKSSLENQGQDENEFDFTLENTFSFEWDELYIVDSYIYPDEISEALGYDCECELVDDPDNQMFFSKNGIMIGAFVTDCRGYSFVKMKDNGVIHLQRDANFRVERRLLNGNDHYYIFKK